MVNEQIEESGVPAFAGTPFSLCRSASRLCLIRLDYLAGAAAITPLVDAADEFVVDVHLLGLNTIRPDCLFMYHDPLDQLVEDVGRQLSDAGIFPDEGQELFDIFVDLMLIVQDQVWNRVTVNRAERKSTRYFMDEFHLLLKEEQTAAYSVEIWKRFRKWGGIPTAITQNVKDLLASREVENIFENSDFVLMLNQAAGDRAILAKQLNISPQQMKYVTHTEAGEGLIFYGNVVLPFVDRFPKDTELYRVMTTKPEEVGEA